MRQVRGNWWLFSPVTICGQYGQWPAHDLSEFVNLDPKMLITAFFGNFCGEFSHFTSKIFLQIFTAEKIMSKLSNRAKDLENILL